MQVFFERLSVAASLLWPCLLYPIQANGYDTSANKNAAIENSTIVRKQNPRGHYSTESTRSELPIPFAGKFIASCKSNQTAENRFFLSRIKLPLKYTISSIDERGKRSIQGTLFELQSNPDTTGFALPLCIGDGGLEEKKIRVDGEYLKIELIFGSGPNEELHFKKFRGRWMLVFVEWIDH